MRFSMVTGVSLLLLLACGPSARFMNDPAGDAGPITIEGGAPPPPPPGCNITKLPKEDPCVVDESAGVFVSSSLGSAAGDGTRQKPFASIQAGIDFAKVTKRRVYVCAETYKEKIAFADGVSVFGDIDCSKAAWKPTTSRALVASEHSPAASAIGIASPLRVEALEIVAPDSAANSIAMVVSLSPSVRLVDVRLHGGKAGSGADGANGVQLTDSGSAKNGENANGNTTCNSMSFICLGGPSTSGGTNQCMGGQSITPQSGSPGGAPGHKMSEYDQNTSSWLWKWKSMPTAPSGSNGAGGTIGMDGKSGVGYFNAETLDFTIGDGTAGADGGAGSGGLGGAGYYTPEPNPPSSYPDYHHWGIAGGAGGAGGCPGLAAAPGKGGGSSVGLLVWTSGVTIEASTIESSDGGNGGKSGIPGVPTLGGSGGQGLWGALAGGNGGSGGFSGISGNGSGGHSFAIASTKDTMPSTDAKTTLSFGKAGVGVPQRNIDAFSIPSSEDGKSGATYAF
jgi:hypothetical protein